MKGLQTWIIRSGEGEETVWWSRIFVVSSLTHLLNEERWVLEAIPGASARGGGGGGRIDLKTKRKKFKGLCVEGFILP